MGRQGGWLPFWGGEKPGRSSELEPGSRPASPAVRPHRVLVCTAGSQRRRPQACRDVAPRGAGVRDTDSACALFLREMAQNTGRRPSVFLTRKTTTQRGFKHCGVKKGTEVPLASSPRVSEMADGASASLGRANPQQPAFRSRKGGTTASPRAHVGPAVTTALTSGQLRSAVR